MHTDGKDKDSNSRTGLQKHKETETQRGKDRSERQTERTGTRVTDIVMSRAEGQALLTHLQAVPCYYHTTR